MVGKSPYGVAHGFRLAVLKHYGAVAVVAVHYCKGLLGEGVEEEFLAADIFGEGLVVVQMVVGKVGENSGGELQAAYSVLLQAD